MKIYQIAGKQYAASGDDLYERIPEFSPLQQLIEEAPVTAPYSLDRNRAGTRTMLPSLREMLAGSQMAAKNRKHKASVKRLPHAVHTPPSLRS